MKNRLEAILLYRKEYMMKELRKEIEKMVMEFNDAVQNGRFEESTKLDEVIQQKVNEYTSIAKDEAFKALKESGSPMLETVKVLTYPTIRTRDTKEGEDKVPVRIVEDTERPIDPLKLEKFCKESIGYEPDWAHKIEKFNLLLTAQKCKDLGIDPTEVHNSFAMSKLAKDIDLGKNPTSKTKILATLQSIVTAMIGEEYKVVSHDVNYLMSIYSKKNRKALTVNCANHKYLRLYITEICNRCVTGATYSVEYKKIKNK